MIKRIIEKIDQLNFAIGEKSIWFVLAMIVLQFIIVILSKLFGISFIPLDESIWYFNGLIFMLGGAYTLLYDAHVRVDLIYREASDRYKATIDLLGSFVFLLPVMFMTFGLSWGFVLDSWYNFSTNEWIFERADGSPTSLPLLSPFKTVIWVYCLLMALAALSLAGKAWLYLSGQNQTYSPKIKSEQ